MPDCGLAAEVIQTGQGNQTPALLPEKDENPVSGNPEISIFADHCSPDALAGTDSPLSPLALGGKAAESQTTFGGVDLDEKRNPAGSNAGFGESDYLGGDRLRSVNRADDEVSARLEMPQTRAAFDAGKTPVLSDQKTQVLNSPQPKENKKAQSVAIEPLKSSKHGWLIRVRLHSESGKPAIPISYMSDADYRALRRSKKRYEEFKRNIKKQYQETARQSDDAGADSDCP